MKNSKKSKVNANKSNKYIKYQDNIDKNDMHFYSNHIIQDQYLYYNNNMKYYVFCTTIISTVGNCERYNDFASIDIVVEYNIIMSIIL